MPPSPPPDEEDYDSAADSDFAASDAPSTGGESEESENEPTEKRTKKDADGDLEMGSGDEGIVAEARQKKKKKKNGKGKKGDRNEEAKEQDDEDEGGVGIRVRLRSGRGGDEAKKKSALNRGKVMANIDEIWARMNNPSLQPTTLPQASEPEPSIEPLPTQDVAAKPLPPSLREPEQTISIPHIYTFAGQTHTSTKIVPISSRAAQAYLAQTKKPEEIAPDNKDTSTGPRLRRPLARKNLLQPNPTNFLFSRNETLPPRTDLSASTGSGLATAVAAGGKENTSPADATANSRRKKQDKGDKLNTVEKSKLDWEAEVERLGLREELEKAEKSGTNYLGRKKFLDRVEGRKEEDARKRRLAGGSGV